MPSGIPVFHCVVRSATDTFVSSLRVQGKVHRCQQAVAEENEGNDDE